MFAKTAQHNCFKYEKKKLTYSDALIRRRIGTEKVLPRLRVDGGHCDQVIAEQLVQGMTARQVPEHGNRDRLHHRVSVQVVRHPLEKCF